MLEILPLCCVQSCGYSAQSGISGLLKQLRALPRETLVYAGEEATRETSLAATLELSYRALPNDAQVLLPVLALFPAGLSRAAAQATIGERGVAALATLARYAMAERRADALALTLEGDDQTMQHRFVLPEPARRYAEHYQTAGLLDLYAPAALAYMQGFIAAVDEQISGRGKVLEGRALLTLEAPNWRLLLDWGYTNEQKQGICQSARATASLGNYWTLTGEKGSQALLDRLNQAFQAAHRLGDHSGEANVQKAIGDVQQFRDEREAALGSYQQALTIYRQIGDRLGEANVLAAQSRLLLDDQPDVSQQLLEAALALRRSIQDVYGEGADLGNYGIALLQRNRYQEALTYLQRARALFLERGLRELLPPIDNLLAQARAAARACAAGGAHDPPAQPQNT